MQSSISSSEGLRPTNFEEIFGQKPLTDALEKSINASRPISLLFWGPPGCGKTSLAKIYIRSFSLPYHIFNATKGSLSELKKLFEEREISPLFAKRIILFIDEIHRLTKPQQDFFLPLVERGDLILIGATTENPSFTLNSALLSRLRIFSMSPLDNSALSQIIDKFQSIYSSPPLTEEVRKSLIEMSQGDGRQLIHLLENRTLFDNKLTPLPKYDRAGDGHYKSISALHKAIRGSDPDSALYWLARMLNGGEDPIYLFRRLIRISIEDIGLSDPGCLPYITAAMQAFEKIGLPEGDLLLASCVVYLALSPKSNAIYTAFREAQKEALKSSHLPPPSIITDGKGYLYDHDLEDAFSGQNYLPDGLERPSYYHPAERGFERELQKRLTYFTRLRERLNLKRELQ